MTGAVATTGPRVTTASYNLEVSREGRWAYLSDHQGRPWARLSLLAALDTVGARDETLEVMAPEVLAPEVVAPEAADDDLRARIVIGRRSSQWDRAGTVLDCYESFVLIRAEVRGEGRLDAVSLLGGRSTMPDCLGRVYSGCDLPELFSPNPEDPHRITRPSGQACVVGVTGDSLPGRGHWFFTPAPLYLALTADGLVGPSAAGQPQGWLALGVVEQVQQMDFTELAYVPSDRGFHLELHYEGHRSVQGDFRSPAVVVAPGVPGPYAGISAYREVLVSSGAVPAPRQRERPDWWSRPMFCGWGAQCHLAAVDATTPAEQCTEANYDRFLAELAAHGLVPPTIVIDDGWQREYTRAAPEPDRWPDLRSWVGQRHLSGQRVLLWWKAWDFVGLPADWCITNSDGVPVGINPRRPEVQRLTRENMSNVLGPSGLDADGLKIDFTARTPSGYGLSDIGRWGIALLHEYLELVYAAAKDVKPDAILVTHTPNPAFANVSDMVRLNDMVRLDDANPGGPVVAQMRYRAAVARAACPELLIDTDDWCAPDLEQWREYLAVKAEIGVPALYYTTHLDRTNEALEERDYAALRDLWAALDTTERRRH